MCSFLHCNVIFLYSFSKIIKKNKKNQIYPKKRMGKVFSLLTASWVSLGYSAYVHLIHQTLGYSTTLGIFARYIELCPPPFGYSSKHMESLCCLLLHRLMINKYATWVLSLVMRSSKGSFSLSLSQPLCNMSLVCIPGHPECPIKSLFEITEAFSPIIKIIKSVIDEPSKTSG